MNAASVRVRDRILRRQEILLAAGRVFIKNGFRLATMEEIAVAAEVGVGTLYNYFKSKEHLFASLLVESAELLYERLKTAAAKPVPPGLGLLAINRAYADYFAEYPDYFRIQLVFHHDPKLGGEFAKERRKLRMVVRRNFEFLAAKIREGQEFGMFRADVEPMAAATVLWASYTGLFLAATNPALLELADLSVEKLLSAAAYVHFAGLGTEGAPGPMVQPAGVKVPSTVSLTSLQEVVRDAPWISPSMIFAGMRMAFLPERTRGFRETYQYRLSGRRGGVWTVSIDDGTISIIQGESAGPAIVLEMSAEDFIRLVTAQIDAGALWMSGDLKVIGDLQRAALFRTFFLSESAPDSNDHPAGRD
jgi:TetR/AcrR family transcriptional regulator